MTNNIKILGIGNALVDVLIQLPNDDLLSELGFPRGSMQLIDFEKREQIDNMTSHLPRSQASGGSAANTIHGLAKLGVQTGYIGKISNDETGIFFKNDMSHSGISPILLYSSTPSGKAMALISKDSERTFGTYLGAAVEMQGEELKEEYFEGYQHLHIEGYLAFNHDLMTQAGKLAKKLGMKVSLDMASFNVVELNREFLLNYIKEYTHFVFANEEEAKALTGAEPHEALELIAQMCETAIVKLGSKGSIAKHKGAFAEAGVIKANPIDTTGAGDLYASGFLTGFYAGKDLQTCMQFGAITAGKVIEVLGPKMDEKTWSQIHTMINEIS